MNIYEPFNPRRRAVFAMASTAASAVVFAAALLLFDRASRLEEPALARAPATSPVPAPAPAAAPGATAAAIVADAACTTSDAPATCAPPWGLNP